MTTATLQASPPKYANAADWWHGLGDIPLERIIFDPLPGTATEKDLLVYAERDHRLCELLDGTLVEKPMGLEESLIAAWIITYLNNFVMPRKLGFVSGADGTLRMISGRVRLPDVAFISIDDLPNGQLPSEPIPTIPPTLAIEVLSAGNTKLEIQQKLKEYFESGCRLAWIIDPPTRTVAVYERLSDEPTHILTENDSLDGAQVLVGFTLPVAELFNKLP